MSAIADAVTNAGTSEKTTSSRPLETAAGAFPVEPSFNRVLILTDISAAPIAQYAVRASLLSSPVEGYAQACLALAQATDPDYSKIAVPTLILAGSEDKTCPKATVDFLSERIKDSTVETLQDVGHWHQ